MKKLTILLFLFFSACAAPSASQTPQNALPSPQLLVQTLTPSPTATLTPTPTVTPVWVEKFTIAGMRQREYPGGKLELGKAFELDSGITQHFIKYPSDGLTITGVLQIPNGQGPFPVIVLNHGYYNRWAYNSGDGTDRIALVLNRAGYLTVSSDYRGWGGSDVGVSLFYTGLATDVLNLLAVLPQIPQADTSRIGMLGHSMGGGVTAKALAADTQNRIRAAVFYATVSADDADILNRWGYGCIGDNEIAECVGADTVPDDTPEGLKRAYLDATRNADALKRISPIYHLGPMQAAIQIHTGSLDGQIISTTPVEWSEKLYQAFSEAKKPVEIFRYADQGHSFLGEGRDLFLQRIVLFFNKQVRGD